MAAQTLKPSFFDRLARFAYRRKWYMLGAWAAGLVGIAFLTQTIGGEYANEFTLPGTESQRAIDLLEDRFPARSGSDAQLVFQAPDGIADPEVGARIEAIVAEAEGLPGVVGVTSPLDAPEQVADSGTIAFANVRYGVQSSEVPLDDAKALQELATRASDDGLRVVAGGDVALQAEQPEFGSAELIGLGAAAVILVIVFGSVVAMGVPIVTALLPLAGSLGLLTVLTHVLSLSEFTPSFAAMIGIGVGIDYALLVITRFREGIHRGLSTENAVAAAVETAGRAVLFAGSVVIVAMLGLLLIGVPFMGALGLATAIVVGMAVLAALTLLPALLSALGHRVDSLSIPGLRTREDQHRGSIWYTLSLAIQRHPLWFAAGGLAVLGVLSIPFFSMNLAFTDSGNNRPETQTRQAYDLLTEGFGPGFNGPLTIVVDVRTGSEEAAAAVAQAVEGAENISSVSDPVFNQARDTAIVTAYPGTSPQDKRTEATIHELRDQVIPGATRGTGAEAYVAGSTAGQIDVGERISSRTPLFFVMVIGLSFLLLMSVFRSVFIPLKAAIFNVISVGASYGVVVAVFQWGWLAGPLGIEQTGPIEPFLPIMMFAILFGLSMDYEVFLVSRIREEHVLGARTSRAIATGLASTARVITSAALIMIAVFGSFILGDERVIKEFGLGLATAIFLDATVVRLLLVPSVMELLGRWNWWLPSWLERVLPNLHVEAEPHLQAEGAE